jgi:hypothetical protein
MLETHLRHACSVLLESAIRIAPPDTRDWGRAMRGELDYVEGQWAAAMWALGGVSVLAKQTLISLIVPGRGGENLVPDGGLFAKSPALRKAALITGGACILVALLFFASPPFRQAFQVAVSPWHVRPHVVGYVDVRSPLLALAKRAEARRDAEGLAFCAVRLGTDKRWADEAVQLDPSLLWVYPVLAIRNPKYAEKGEWLNRLEQQDPDNALFYLIEAQAVENEYLHDHEWKPSSIEQVQAWHTAMAAVFNSTKFDDYLDRVNLLTRHVVPRYGFYNLFEVDSRSRIDLPIHAFEHCDRYARWLLSSGAEMEAKGNRKAAREQYWTVARFGQLIDSQAHTDFEHWMGTALQSLAYNQLQASAQKEGNTSEAALFGYLASKFDPAKGRCPSYPQGSAFGFNTAHRNAAVVEISGLMVLLFAALVAIAASILLAGSRRWAGPVAQQARPVAVIVILSGAVGMLFSSVTLYLTYRPYWYIFQTAILNGERVPSADLQFFLTELSLFHGVSSPHLIRTLMDALFYSGSPSFLFYVWTGATLLGVIGLALIVLRRLRGRPRANPP